MNAITQLLSRRLPRDYRNREEAKLAWARRYSNSEWEQVERFLLLFCDAFLLRRSGASHLYPDDKPMDIYQEIFRFWPVDDLQFPFLHKTLAREYGVNVPMADFERQTLAELYERVRHKS